MHVLQMSVRDYCQYLRSAIEVQPAVVGVDYNSTGKSKVLARTKSLYWTNYPTSRWQARVKSSGAALPHQPFRTFGRLPDGHVYEWLAYSFKIKPPKNLFFPHHEQSVSSTWKQIQPTRATSPFIRVPILSTTKGHGAQTHTLKGGMSSLKLSLTAIEKCSKTTKIGIPYKQVPVFSSENNKPKGHLIAQKADEINIFSNMMTGIAASRFKRSLKRNYISNDLQNDKDYFCKLQAIYSILCSLHNIKSKDLKSKTPVQSSLLDYMSSCHLLHKEHKECNVVDKRLVNIFESTKIPPWQMQIVFIDEKADESEGNELQLKLESCYERHRQLKTEFSWKIKEEIEERERTSAHLLQIKLQELKFGPNPVKQFKLMREKAQYICSQEKDNKPLWYTDLKGEIESILEGKERRAKGEELLEKLNAFTTEDPSSIPHVLEKFCLLAMSTPAHELCTVPVIEAIKFVLEKILSTSSKLCKQWLELRQLPWQQYFY